MSVVRQIERVIARLNDQALAAWADVSAAVASDAQARTNAMVGAISPLCPTMRIVAQARTVSCTVGDNSALHAAISKAEPGQVLVCDGKGFEDQALFGGLMTAAAQARRLAGLVIDGAVRDSQEIIEAGFPCFARAVVPRGPHKAFGGTLDEDIACGGIAVRPGDLIIADADGVTRVPYERIESTLTACRAALAREARAREEVAGGGSLATIYGVPEVELVDGDSGAGS